MTEAIDYKTMNDPAIVLIHKMRGKRTASEKFTREDIKNFNFYMESFEGSVTEAAYYAKISRATFYAVKARKSGRPDTMIILRSAMAARRQELRPKDLFTQ